MELTVGEIAALCGGRVLSGKPETVIRHVTLDSREQADAALFVPIRGEKTDGHRYIDGAFASGAEAALTAEPGAAGADRTCILVNDTRAALQELGKAARSVYRGRVVGITGSVGKTTTRELVKCALAAGGSVTGTAANRNSQLGVPQTLCHMDPSADRAVIEMGVSMPGEMEKLTAMVRPDTVIVTNIGTAHLEFMGSRETILREKMHIADSLQPDGCAILNGDDALLRSLRGKTPFRTLYFGFGEDCDLRAEDIVTEEDGSSRFTAVFRKAFFGEEKRIPCRLQVTGKHNIGNALSALGAAYAAGVDPAAAAAGLAAFTGFPRRLERKLLGGITVIDDSYNAGPASVCAALDVLASVSGRKLALLADMKELGTYTEAAHREIGEKAASVPAALYVTLGDSIRAAEAVLNSRGLPVRHADSPEDAVRILTEALQPGDTLLVKGSNSMRLDRVIEALCTQIS